MTIGSLFSGIGGLDLGLEWAGLGPTLWQVEKDPFCRRKLAWRWPGAQQFEDVRDVGAANLLPVDLICGGFPCQDISSAGKRAGLAGARSGLWNEFARVIAEMRPRWVVVENVRSGASKWVDPVRGALEQLGYATLPVPIGAGDCGAPHERARVFVVACALAHGHHEVVAQAEHGRRRADEPSGVTADADCVQLWEQQRKGRPAQEGLARPAADADHDESNLWAAGWESLSDAERHRGWAAEPALARVVHGLPGRVDYERALGNAVVPQCAEVVGHVILQLAGGAA